MIVMSAHSAMVALALVSVVLSSAFASAEAAAAFVSPRGGRALSTIKTSTCSTTVLQMAKKAAKKKKKKSKPAGGASGGLKGFGSSPALSTTPGSANGAAAEIDRSKESLAFYDYLEKNGAGDNLKRVALAHFPITDTLKIRGVITLRPIKKGEPIIDIPYELAMNLGRESSDPTLPAATLLQEYCRWKSGQPLPPARKRDDGPYLQMLPPYLGADCLGSTDFFSDDALDELQYPPVKDETLRRRVTTQARFERDVEPMTQISSTSYTWDEEGNSVTEQHLRWAVWLVTSRVLTVQGDVDSGESYRLMIPLIDMCNHDRSSPHVLSGRATAGGRLRVLAGRNIEAGEQVNICYGGGVAGNDRFVQDYGFLDTFDDGTAFDLVANTLAGTARPGEFGFGGRSSMSSADRAAALEALGKTTIEQDEAALAAAEGVDIRTSFEYRIGVKKALERLKAKST